MMTMQWSVLLSVAITKRMSRARLLIPTEPSRRPLPGFRRGRVCGAILRARRVVAPTTQKWFEKMVDPLVILEWLE